MSRIHHPISRSTALAVVLLAATTAPAQAQVVIEAMRANQAAAAAMVGQRPEWARGALSGGAQRFIIGPDAYEYVTEEVRSPRKKSGAPGIVAGLVYERATRRPVANVSVRLTSTEPQWEIARLEARTDSAGYYEFARVEPGSWDLGIVGDRLSPVFATPRTTRRVNVAKKEKVAAAPFVLERTSCVQGKAVWSDGVVVYDAPVTVAPYDTTLLSRGGELNGIGAYDVCRAPLDSVMVWMHLRDGRSLGRTTRLIDGNPRTIDFKPDPIETMEGCVLRVLPVLNDGTPVPRAQVTVVGRRFEQGARPAVVFVRENTTDADGVAEFKVPFGNFEVLVVNPREGQTGTVRQIVNFDQKGVQPLRVELRGQTTAVDRRRMHDALIDRAETYLYLWTQ